MLKVWLIQYVDQECMVILAFFDPVTLSGWGGCSLLLAGVFARCTSRLGDLCTMHLISRGTCMGVFQLCSGLGWKAGAGWQSFLLCPLKFRIDAYQNIRNWLRLYKYILTLPLLSMPLSTWKRAPHFCLRIRSYYVVWKFCWIWLDLTLCHNSGVL